MKRFSTALATLALALGVWAFFRISMPEAPPLTPPATSVVVAVCASMVCSLKWMWKGLHKRKVKKG